MNMTKTYKQELRALDRAEKKLGRDQIREQKRLMKLARQSERKCNQVIKTARRVLEADVRKINQVDVRAVRAHNRELDRIAKRRAILEGRLTS